MFALGCPTGEMSFARCGPHKGGHYARSVNTEGKAIPTHRKGNTRGHYARALVNTEGKAIPTHVGIPVDELVPEYE